MQVDFAETHDDKVRYFGHQEALQASLPDLVVESLHDSHYVHCRLVVPGVPSSGRVVRLFRFCQTVLLAFRQGQTGPMLSFTL